MLKTINNPLIKIIITIFLIFYFLNTLDLNKLYQQFENFQNLYLILSLIIFLPNTYLFILKWYYVINKFSKEKLINLYIKLSKSIMISEIFQNSLLIDASKYFYLRKINIITKVSLLSNDKFITLISKIFYLTTLMFIVLFFFFYDELSLLIKNYLIYIILFFGFLFLLFLLFKNTIQNYYYKYLSEKIIPRRKIFFIELFRNIIMTGVYFFSFFQFYDLKTTLVFLALSPLIETALRFQIVSSIGIRELIIFTLGTKFGLEQNIILPSIFITIVTFLTSLNNFIIANIVENLIKKKTKKINLSVYLNNNNFKGTEDFYEQLRNLIQYIPKSSFSKELSFKTKKFLIVENFVNPIEFFKILFFLIFYRGKSYLIHTEFITKTNKIYSYNDFNKEVRTGLFFSLLRYLIIRFKRFLKFKYTNTDKRIVFLTYFQYRFFTTKILSKFFDFIVLAHPKMEFKTLGFNKNNAKHFPYFFKKLTNLKTRQKEFELDFSGYLTSYRFKKLKNLKYNKKIFNDNNILKLINRRKTQYFIKSKKTEKKNIFSLHIEKEINWPYSSPARYYNSLKKNEIPVIFKKFKDVFSNMALDKKILNIKSKKSLYPYIERLNLQIEKNNLNYKKNIQKLIGS